MVTPTTCVNGEHSWTSVTCLPATRRSRSLLLLEASTPPRKRRCLSQLFGDTYGYLRNLWISIDIYGYLKHSCVDQSLHKVVWFCVLQFRFLESNSKPPTRFWFAMSWWPTWRWIWIVGSQKPQPLEPVKVSHIHKDSPYRDTLFIFKVCRNSQHVKHPDLQVNTASCHIASADVQAYLVVIDGKHDSLGHRYVFRLEHGATW